MNTFLENVHPEELPVYGECSPNECQDCPYCQGCFDQDDDHGWDDEPDQFLTDVEADADALASAGFGTDEDYGYYGEGDEW